MNLIWTQGRPLTSNEIVELLPEKTWKNSTIHLILNKMLQKKLIKEAGMVRSGKTYARIFDVVVTMEEFMSERIKDDLAYKNNKNKLLISIMSDLLDDTDIKLDVVCKLENVIIEKKRTLEELHKNT